MLIEVKRDKGKSYRAGYRDPNGKQITRTFRRKVDAQAWIEANRTDMRRGEWTDPSEGRKPIAQVYEEMHIKRRYSLKTLKDDDYTWNAHIPEAIRKKSIGDLTKPDVDKLLAGIDGPEARRKTRLLISRMFNSTDDLQRLPNPARLRKQKATREEKRERDGAKYRPKTYLTSDELDRLMAEMPERYRMLIEIMARLGLRPGEAFALRVGKVNLTRREVLIDTSTSGFTKTGLARTVKLPSIIAEDLAHHLAAFSNLTDPDALVFPWQSNDGPMIDASNFRKVFNAARDAAGITDNLTPNSCRHTAVSYAISLGATIYEVQEMVGHERPSITLDVYGQKFREAEKDEDYSDKIDRKMRKDRERRPEPGQVVELHASEQTQISGRG